MIQPDYHPSVQFDSLKAVLSTLPESDGVLRLNCEIPRHPSFFPGGRGYQGPSFPSDPVMFIGHNFDTCFNFYKSVKRGHEDDLTMKTWINLRKFFLPTAGLHEGDCFFTNFYLGAIIHPEPKAGNIRKQKNTGEFRCSPIYRSKCIEILRDQVTFVRPRVIALLGAAVPAAFGAAFPEYATHLGGNLRETQSKQPKCGHRVFIAHERPVRVVALFHPANPRSHESHRAQGAILRAANDESRR